MQNEYMRKTITTSEYSNLISWLIDARQRLGWSMRELAEKLAQPHSFVQRIEMLERRLDVYEYTVYCEALNIDPLHGIKLMTKSTAHKAK